MKSFYLVLAVIFSVAVTISADPSEEDLRLRSLFTGLCQANREGVFGSCCDSESNGTNVLVNNLPDCLGSVTVSNSMVSSLSIFNKGLTTIPSGVFPSFPSLVSLDLMRNSLTELVSGTFESLSNLASLSLTYNRLAKIATGAFEGLTSLQSLWLSDNSLIYLEENIFGANTVLPNGIVLGYNHLIALPKRFSSGTVTNPSQVSVAFNCLDCSKYSYISSGNCGTQSNTYCPTDTNKCNNINVFQKNNCFKCNSSDTNAFCDVCLPGYKHTVSGCGCVKCEEGEACEFGKVRDFDSPCSQCTSASSSSASVCTSCSPKYRYVEGDCVACEKNACCPGGRSGSASILNCTQCSDDQKSCLSCEVGTKYVYDEDEDYATCKPCGEGECCLGKNFNDTCAQCTDDMTGCKTCHAKKQPVGGVCVPGGYGECWPEGRDPANKIEHCISCREEDDGCALCEKDYRNQDGVCVEKSKYKSSGIMNGVNVVLMSIVVIISIIGMF